MTNGQKAYEAYSEHQGQKAHDRSSLPGWEGVPAENQSAWEAFGKAVSEGVGVDTAYNNVYLDAVKGKAMSGGPAPSFAFLVYNRPDIASAWAAAANAVK